MLGLYIPIGSHGIDTNFSCILSTRVVWRRIAACGGGDLDIHIGVRGMWVGHGGRQEQRTGDTCGRVHRVRRRGDHHDLRCGSHLRRSHEPCCYYCLRNRQTLPLVTGTIQCESWSLWTLAKAKCSDDKTLLSRESCCYQGISPPEPWPRPNALMTRPCYIWRGLAMGAFHPLDLDKGKMPSRQDLVKAGEVLPWGHSPWPRCRGAKAKCPDGKTSGPLYLMFPLLHLGVQRCVEL